MHIMVNKRYMWKFDTCAGHEALIIKLLVKKPPGIMSADSTSIARERCASRPFKALRRRKKKREREKRQIIDMPKIDGGKETNIESGTRRRIFGAWLRSMGLAQVDYPMHPADGTLHRSELGQ